MRSRAIIVVAALGAALVSGGWLLQRGAGGATGGGPFEGARLFDNVLTHVERYYVDTVDSQHLYEKAVEGMLYELHDPHSVFLNPTRLGRLTESTTGMYGGLGIQIDIRDGWITIIAPLPGSPAERAGIETGDRIVAIDGKSTRGLTSDEATKTLRGEPGTEIRLTIERPGVDAQMPFKLVRRAIHTPAVRRVTMLRPGIGYVDINVFSDSTANELRRAIDSLSRRGMHALVLDLRGNPGGLLDQGVGVSDLFLDTGKEIVSMRGRTRDANRAFSDRAPQRWPSLPIVLLQDRGSASASEIVAGALQDHDRAVIVGTTSYGKGSAQSVFPMTGGSALKLTTALWYTPSGRSINRPRTPVSADDDEGDDDGESDSTQTDSAAAPHRYRTDAGRVVYGGGGITPDVEVSDTAASESELTFQRALGQHVPQFRDALTEFALSLRASHVVKSPEFVVSPVMRTELWRRMTSHGVAMQRAVYDSSAALVDRLLSYEISRFVFGQEAEFLRAARDDRAIAAAIALVDGARNQTELLRRAAARQAAMASDSARRDSTARAR
jgi:carboxyl-terminal processing protease